jgi:hypothetical protein
MDAKRSASVPASRFSHALIDLIRTAGGNAVAFQPNGPNLFLADLVVEHVDWGEERTESCSALSRSSKEAEMQDVLSVTGLYVISWIALGLFLYAF